MNAYKFDIFVMHSIVLENTEEDGIYTKSCDLLEIGPLKCPDVKNWWTDFSTWEDFYGILRAGKELSMHLIVRKINNQLEQLVNNVSYIDLVDENGNITIHYDETFPTISQGFKVTAKRKRIRRLKDISAYNVAKSIVSQTDIETLDIPHSLQSLVSMYLDTHSGDYRTI